MRTWPALEVRRPGPEEDGEFELLQAALTDYGVSAIDETAADGWRIFFSTADERDRAAGGLNSLFPELRLQPLDVADQDWVARSQADLSAIRVGAVTVAPPWDIPDPCPSALIVIHPSMGFGTGHHATTRLCLSALQAVDLRGQSVIDAGTGSGVLAITASRLGATRVVALDDDGDALQAAAENVALNAGVQVTLVAGDVRRVSAGTFDVVTANLTGALIAEASAALRALAGAHGRLILSGFMRDEETAVLSAFDGYRVAGRWEEEEWVCVSVQRP